MKGSIIAPSFHHIILILFRILEAIWDAVQMACSTTGTNSDIDTAFDGISDLLRAQSKGTFALSIQRCVMLLYVGGSSFNHFTDYNELGKRMRIL